MLFKEKAFFFVQELNIPYNKISFSNSWIEKFKKRNNIHSYRLHGEANSVSLEILSEKKKKFCKITHLTIYSILMKLVFFSYGT